MSKCAAADVLSALAALAGENEAVVGSNNTTVNKYFGAVGAAYCGYSLMYACKKAGADILGGCKNAAYVPTLKAYLEGRGWRVPNIQAQPGDIFVYTKPGGTGTHTGFVFQRVSGSTVITLEGNNTAVKKTADQARNGTGAAFEGIGYRRLTLDSNYTVYRPPYDTGSSQASAPAVSGKKRFTCAPTVDIVQETSEYSKGACKSLQVLLNAKFGTGLETDGEFGPLTKAALTAAQKKLGVEADGACGKDTWTKLLMH